MKLLHLNFIPRSADAALLVLRLWFGGALLFLHGWDKVMNFAKYSGQFLNFLGMGQTASLVLAIVGELVCSALLVLGLYTRVAAIGAGFTMGVAFWVVHGTRLSGPQSGEMAFLYLGAFVTLFLAGAGKFSLDAKMGAKG